MDVIGVETNRQLHSPLQAAREWRGISLVAAARESGLPVAQAEALEEGSTDAFGSVREMIGAAVVYGSSLGIGRDEAMALLDRTISNRESSIMPPPILHGGLAAFSAAVRERTVVDGRALATQAMADIPVPTAAAAVIAAEDVVVAPLIDLGNPLPVDNEDVDGDTGELPVVTTPTVDAALAADQAYREAWEQSASELEQWAAAREDAPAAGDALVRSVVGRFAGAERADRAAASYSRMMSRVHATGVGFREWMRRSEHGTLIVAIGIGIVAIALMVAISSVVTSKEPVPPAPKQKVATPLPGTTDKPVTKAVPAKEAPAAPVAILPPAKVHVQVLNSGSRKGYAAQMATKIKGLGYRIDTVGNSSTGYATSTILCPQSLSREAQRLSRQTGITTMDTIPDGSRTACIVVLR